MSNLKGFTLTTWLSLKLSSGSVTYKVKLELDMQELVTNKFITMHVTPAVFGSDERDSWFVVWSGAAVSGRWLAWSKLLCLKQEEGFLGSDGEYGWLRAYCAGRNLPHIQGIREEAFDNAHPLQDGELLEGAWRAPGATSGVNFKLVFCILPLSVCFNLG